MKTSMYLAVLTATLLASSAVLAQEAKSPVSVTIDNYVFYDTESATLGSSHEIDATFEALAGDVTLGAELWLGATGDLTAGTITFEIPELTLSASTEKFGMIEIGDADGALDATCVMPAPGSTHFGEEDLMSYGTCNGYSDGLVLAYTSPSLSGFTFHVSAMSDLKGVIAVGEVDSSVSGAVGYEGELDGGATLTASLGVDQATSIKGGVVPGTPLPTTVQGGVAVGWDGWTVGTAAQYEANSPAGGGRWGAGIGVAKEVIENLTLTGELIADGYQDMGVPMQEVGIGTTAEYAIIPDKVLIDATFDVLHRTGGGVDLMVSAVGAGLSVAF